MADNAMMREVTLTLPTRPDMEIAAGETATALAEFMRMSPDKIDEVRMAVVEACINAFEHSQAADGKVYLSFAVMGEAEPEKLQITIRDTGVGFAPEGLEAPKIEEKIKSPRKRGWGLQIIKGLMDEVKISSGSDGTTIVMSKLR